MVKKISSYLKDRSLTFFFYVLNTGVIILYVALEYKLKSITYPFILSLFFFSLYVFMDFSKYFAYMTSLEEALEKEKIEIKSFNEEQSKNLDLFLKMEEKILREKSIYLKKTEDSRYLMSQWVHNLKTPVSVIDLILQETKTKNLDEIEAERVIREIQEENSLIHQGLEQILSLLRLDEFAQDYEPELVDLKKSLEEIINTTKNRFIYSKTFPKIEADLNSYPVLTDSKWNRIMVEQIISNAIKYSMEQNTTKFITFTFEKGPEYVTLHIDDEGIGIPKYDLERLFDPFFTGATNSY